MLYFALAFLGGNAGLLFLKHLLPVAWLLGLLMVCLLTIGFIPVNLKRWLALIIVFLSGLSWSTLTAQQLLNEKIPGQLLNQSTTIIGLIDSIPNYKDNQASFILKIQQIQNNALFFNKPYLVRLNWYFPPDTLRIGEKWQLQVRLKKPIFYLNPGSFDYQIWLFEQRIVATGYVQNNKNNYLLADHYYLKIIDHYREKIADTIQHTLNNQPLAGLIAALAVGVRDNITDEQWEILRGTGTNHLFAIAGLHLGFVSGFAYFLISFIWRRAGRLPLYFPTPLAAVVAALSAAVLYSALAGFSLPTQRALIMTAVFLLATSARKKIPAGHAWSLALIMVLIYNPLAVLSASFWMSFSAVALIIYGASGRLYRRNNWQHLLYPQWIISIGLIPICLLFFQQYSLASFIANIIAIPWVGFLVLPLSLLGGLISTVWPVAGQFILVSAEQLLRIIWPLLTVFAKQAWLQWTISLNNPWLFIAAMVAVILLLMPYGLPGRWLGFLWALPLLIWRPATPESGTVWLTALNLNSGMAVIIRTHSSVIIYESSTKPFINQNTLIPYLQYNHIKHIDRLIINIPASGNDAGLALLNLIPVKQVFLNTLPASVAGNITVCNRLSQWRQDKIDFIVSAYPGKSSHYSGCALTIRQNNFSSLIIDTAHLAVADFSQANLLITADKLIFNNKIYSAGEFDIIKITPVYDKIKLNITTKNEHNSIWISD